MTTRPVIDGDVTSELKEILKKRFQDILWTTLSYLEIVFKHEKGDGSENEKTFNAIRSKILRTGNDPIRELDDILNSYVVLKLYEYKRENNRNLETQIFDFKSKISVNEVVKK